MPNPNPNPEADSKDDPRPKSKTVQVVVGPRSSLMVQDKSGAHYLAKPGAVVDLPKEEAARMRAGGFLADSLVPAPAALPTETVAEPRPTINGRDNSMVGAERD